MERSRQNSSVFVFSLIRLNKFSIWIICPDNQNQTSHTDFTEKTSQ